MRLYCVEYRTEDFSDTQRVWFSTKKEANKYYMKEGLEYSDNHADYSLNLYSYDFTTTKRGIQDLLNWVHFSNLVGGPRQLIGVDKKVIRSRWEETGRGE